MFDDKLSLHPWYDRWAMARHRYLKKDTRGDGYVLKRRIDGERFEPTWFAVDGSGFLAFKDWLEAYFSTHPDLTPSHFRITAIDKTKGFILSNLQVTTPTCQRRRKEKENAAYAASTPNNAPPFASPSSSVMAFEQVFGLRAAPPSTAESPS